MKSHIKVEGKEIVGMVNYPDHYPPMEGWQIYEPGVPDNYNSYYFLGGKLRPKKPRPSEFHEFNYETLNWDFDANYFWSIVRGKRNRMISASDWTQLPDIQSNMSDELKLSWATYRQALRDITDQEPLKIVWPTPPN